MAISILTKLLLGLVCLLIVVRVQGKKSMKSLTPYDFVYSLVLGGILEDALYDQRISLLHLTMAIFFWGLMIFALEKISYKFDLFSRLIRGVPSILVYDNKIHLEELKKNNLELEQLRNLLRQEKVFSLENARHVILETGGQVTVIPYNKEDDILTFLVIDRGRVKKRALEEEGLSMELLLTELKNQGMGDIKDVLYAEWSREKGFYFIGKSDIRKKNVYIDG